MKKLLKPKKRLKRLLAYNERSNKPIHHPESCVVCGASIGDAELGTLICYRCQHEDPMFVVLEARKHKKI